MHRFGFDVFRLKCMYYTLYVWYLFVVLYVLPALYYCLYCILHTILLRASYFSQCILGKVILSMNRGIRYYFPFSILFDSLTHCPTASRNTLLVSSIVLFIWYHYYWWILIIVTTVAITSSSLFISLTEDLYKVYLSTIYFIADWKSLIFFDVFSQLWNVKWLVIFIMTTVVCLCVFVDYLHMI